MAVPKAGGYQISARVSGRAKDGRWPMMGVVVDGYVIGHQIVQTETATDVSFETSLEAGTWSLGVQLLNESEGLFDSVALRVESIRVAAKVGDASPALSTPEAWLASAQARDAAVLAASDAAIAQHRTGDRVIQVENAAGDPLVGVAIAARQIHHAFLFGCNIAGLGQFGDARRDAAYAEQFEAIFNYATIPLYWRYLEPVKGRRDYPRVDHMVDWCAARSIAMKGHPLLWDSEHGVPAWLADQPDTANQRAHVEDLLGRYADRIAFWEVVNEPANHPGVALQPAHGWARSQAPGAQFVVNEYGPFYNGHPEFHDMLQTAAKADTPFDAVGIQAHAPPDMAFPFARVQRVLDRYAALGKRIHITEFTPPSQGGAIRGAVWRGTWSEQAQADYAEELYRVLFAHPAVDAISWWDFADQGAWIPNGGLLRADATPKPAYSRLRTLLQETWRTQAEGATDAQGTFTLHGFYGTYTLTLTYRKKTSTHTIELDRDGPSPLRIVLE
jgi:GH35 family endo-1,4-beta-xylanase